jgi:hypothetical protein
MQQETLIVGEKEYTCVRMNPFEANKLLIRIQKIVMPIMGSVAGNGKGLLDLDIKVVAATLAEHLDESVMDAIVLPMFSEARLYSTGDKKFVKDAVSINQVFTTENLFDLYELVWLVGRFQFGPFFVALMARFGAASVPASMGQSPASLTTG